MRYVEILSLFSSKPTRVSVCCWYTLRQHLRATAEKGIKYSNRLFVMWMHIVMLTDSEIYYGVCSFQSAEEVATNPMYHKRSKLDLGASERPRLIHVRTVDQSADIYTKALTLLIFSEDWRRILDEERKFTGKGLDRSPFCVFL